MYTMTNIHVYLGHIHVYLGHIHIYLGHLHVYNHHFTPCFLLFHDFYAAENDS